MKKEQLKILIKEIVKEIRRKRIGGGVSGKYETYEIELENIAIPGISVDGDYVLITTTIEYEITPGYEAKLHGPPENCYPGEETSIDIIDQYPTLIKSINKAGKEITLNRSQLTPEQLQVINVAIEKYINDHRLDVDEKILDTFDNEPDDAPDPEPDDRVFNK